MILNHVTKLAHKDILWLIILSLSFFTLLLPISSYVAALRYIQDEWSLNNFQAGVVYSAYLAGYLISALFIIPLTDRVGPKPVFLASAILSIITHILFPIITENMIIAIVLRGICGVGLVGMYMPGIRIISERFDPKYTGTSTGIFVTAQYAAHSISMALTGVLLTTLEWREAYLVLSLISIIGLPMLYLLLRSHSPTKSHSETPGKLDLSVLKIPQVKYFILGYSLHAFQLYSVRMGLPILLGSILINQGINNGEAIGSTVAGIALTIGALGPVMGGAISDKWGRLTSAIRIFAISGICSLLIGWAGGFPWPLIGVILIVYGWSTAADSAIYTSGILDSTPKDRIGSALAVQASLGLLGAVLGPITFGTILDISQESYKWVIGFSSISLIAIIAILALQRLKHDLVEKDKMTRNI